MESKFIKKYVKGLNEQIKDLTFRVEKLDNLNEIEINQLYDNRETYTLDLEWSRSELNALSNVCEHLEHIIKISK